MSGVPATIGVVVSDDDRDPLEDEELRVSGDADFNDLESARQHRWMGGEAGIESAQTSAVQTSSGLTIPQNYRFPWWRAILAAFLILLGFILFLIGAVNGIWLMIIIGLILMLPGGYQVFLIVQVMRKVPGYEPEGIFERLEQCIRVDRIDTRASTRLPRFLPSNTNIESQII